MSLAITKRQCATIWPLLAGIALLRNLWIDALANYMAGPTAVLMSRGVAFYLRIKLNARLARTLDK